MKFPRLPDWVVYAAIIVAVLFAALGRAVETELSERQRRVFEAIVLNEVPLSLPPVTDQV